MIGLMDKNGQGGGLSQLFANNQPAVTQGAPMQIPQIAAPQYGPSLMPSPEQSAAATRARMLARTPTVAPAQEKKPFQFPHGGGSNR